MLELRRINAGYGRAQILFDLDLELRAGEVTALLGRNGAGKSTTLKTAMGLLPASSGKIFFQGEEINGYQPYQIARLGLGYVPEDRRIFTDLTVMENLEAGRQAPRAGAPGWTPEKLCELFPNLGRMRDRRGGSMSGGEQQMLAIARALMGNPSALLLDEPFEGLAPLIVEGMARTVRELKREGLSVLLCEQNLRFARLVADRACIIEKGHVRYAGAMAALDADPALRERYLSV
ncbi:MAG TPA: ABC transporter ATP-binding protein [Burkholderiales bacterium]|nr:ABC transporter ATP-binding protein [Burkholderiales bacterium]